MNAGNPFATRHTRPGRLAALDAAAAAVDAGRLLARLDRLGGRAAIVGPHGSGKSTLLVHLADTLDQRGAAVVRIRLRSWRDAARLLKTVWAASSGTTVCVDSWECAGPVMGGLVWLVAKRNGCRLLVTGHRRGGWPLLRRCRPTCAVLAALVRQLPGHAEWYGRIIVAADIRDAYRRHGGDIREALFDLYDRFEARRRRHGAVRL